MSDPRQPLDVKDIIVRAACGLGKVDRDGRRGVTLCDMEEIEAMALLLAALGLPAVPRGLSGAARTAKAAELAAFLDTHFNTPLNGGPDGQ